MTASPTTTIAAEKQITIKSRLHSWQTYIEFEIKDNQFSRAQRLYERALLDCQSMLAAASVPSSSTEKKEENVSVMTDETTQQSALCLFWEEYAHFVASTLHDYRLLGIWHVF